MSDAAFIFALVLGGIILVGMLLVSHSASSKLSKRQLKLAQVPRASDDEPDLFEVTDEASAIRASREIRKRIKETIR